MATPFVHNSQLRTMADTMPRLGTAEEWARYLGGVGNAVPPAPKTKAPNTRENPSRAGLPGLAEPSPAGRNEHAAHAAHDATALVTPLRPFGVTVPPC